MSDNHKYCVLMAGGLGTRFWPVSRRALPKQFLDFTSTGRTFLRRTYERMLGVIPPENIIVVTLKEYENLVREQIPELPKENLLLELYNRNTAPCIAYATRTILERDPEAVTVALPCDHIVSSRTAFRKTVNEAIDYASTHDELVTIGIHPTRPDVNFGYIQVAGDSSSVVDNVPVKVKTFTEKPPQDIAELLFKSGEFLWNSGVFIWKAKVIMDELEKFAPQITSLWKYSSDTDRIYTDCERISIDYAVMEKTSRAAVIPAGFGWADIGNWQSLYEYMASPDGDGNVVIIGGKHLFIDNSNNIIYCDNKDKLLAMNGLHDMIVVDTRDVLMVCPRDEQKLKEFLSKLAMPEFEDFR